MGKGKNICKDKNISILAGIFLMLMCTAACGQSEESKAANMDSQSIVSETDEESVLAAYSSFLAGDKTFLDEAQTEAWWIPDFNDEGMEYEYTYLDLSGDGVAELIVQMKDNPCGYNAVFHFQDGKIFCWNSDTVEMSDRDYPLNDGTMVSQYDYNGTRSYTIFRYQANGETKDISTFFMREELIPEYSPEPCPYYAIDGKEVDKAVFEEQFDALVTGRMLERSAWTSIQK